MHAGSSAGGNAPRLARAAWLALAGLTLVLFAAGLPLYWDRLQAPCSGQACLPEQLPAETLIALANLGLSARRYALLALGVNLAVSLISVIIGVILFWRRPADWAAWTTSLLLVTLPPANIVLLLPTANQAWELPVQGLGWIAATLLAVVFYTFPNGRFVPGWTRPLAILWTALMAVDNFNPGLAAQLGQSDLFGLAGSALIASMALAQVVRYRRFSSAVERQQTKWVVVGTALGLGLFVAYTVSVETVPALGAPGSLFLAGRVVVQNGLMLLIAASIGIAASRYRLWDIDVLVNRALVYGALTLALSIVYFGSVIVFQSGLRLVTGQGTALATVSSTLLLAALFRPLRARLQATIDRRFYRRRYDAAQVALAFAARVRNEVDLERSTEALIAVVRDTLEPSQVWLWLPRRPANKG